MTVLSWVLRGLVILVVYEVLRYWIVGRVRRHMHATAVEFVRRHKIQLESARFIDRVWMREALAQDPTIDEAIAQRAKETGEPVLLLRDRVDEYVTEIAPYFSVAAYYRFGAAIGKRVVNFCFEVVIDQSEYDAQVAKAPPGAVRVYVINHRANMDPLILSFGLLNRVPMSYAVGEWALVWPLSFLFRSFGSYFVRRGERDPLYHKVLERFLQLMAGKGAVTGFFIEGGLSRDGALRPAKTGLLEYLIRLRRDQPDREIVFMPVGLNYDRVFEDRILTRETLGPLPEPTPTERLFNLFGILFWVPALIAANTAKVATGSHRKFGYAAVAFGEPLRLTHWDGGATLHLLDDEARHAKVGELADELLFERIAAVVPALPVPIFCTALRREGPLDETAITGRIMQVLEDLRARGAPIALGRAFDRLQNELVPTGMPAMDEELQRSEEAEQIYILASMSLVRRRVLREVVTPTGAGVEVVEGNDAIVKYYANSIAHHFEPVPETSLPG